MSFEIGTATDYYDLLVKLGAWLTAKGSAFGLQYSGTGDGRFTAYRGGSSSVAETFTITATSSTLFDVVGSVTGSIGPATVGTPFSHATIEFTIVAGGTAFVSGDEFLISTAPKWIQRRFFVGATVTATEGNSGQLAAQNLVDGKDALDDDRYWRVDAPTIPQYIEFSFGGSVQVDAYELARFATAAFEYAPKDWDFQYWDGDSWETLDSQTNQTAWGPEEVKRFAIGSPVSAALYRLAITADNGNGRLYLGAARLLRTSGPAQARGDLSFAQGIWIAPGNDGVSEYAIAVHHFQRQDADYFNWEVCSLDGFATDIHLYNQAGIERQLYLPLRNASIPYWFVNDGRRVVVAAKVNVSYEVAILGASLDPYFSPNQLPFPLALGGTLAFGTPEFNPFDFPTWEDPVWRFSNATNQHRSPIHADPANPFYGPEPRSYQLRARNLDGSWSGYEGSLQDSITVSPAGKPIIWPTRCGVSKWDPNLDAGYQLLPVMLCHDAPNIQGRLNGIRAVSGQGATAESLAFDGAIDWLVLPNITRSDRDDWLAVALD